jgi:hypothetical protein
MASVRAGLFPPDDQPLSGGPAQLLSPYLEAGCSAFNVIPCADDVDSAIDAVGEFRALLTASRCQPLKPGGRRSRF